MNAARLYLIKQAGFLEDTAGSSSAAFINKHVPGLSEVLGPSKPSLAGRLPMALGAGALTALGGYGLYRMFRSKPKPQPQQAGMVPQQGMMNPQQYAQMYQQQVGGR